MESKKEPSKDQLSGLIRRIYQYGANDSRQWDERASAFFAERFETYYEEGNYNLYSPTYEWLSGADQDVADYLERRLGDIEQIFRANKSSHLREFVKLRDYIILEAARANDFAVVQEVATRGEKSWDEVRKLNDEIKMDMKRLKEDAQEDRKNTNTQSITVLSIFTGIAMAFFGGFSLLGSAFNALGENKVPLPDIAIISLIIGFVLFNTIFALIGIACRISGIPPTQPDHSNCSECVRTDRCDKEYADNFLKRWFVRFKRKYPYALAVNIIIVALLFVSCIFSIIVRFKQ